MTYLVVLPVLSEPIADRCVASLQAPDSAAGFDAESIFVVDNSRGGFAAKYGYRTYRDPAGHNIGVARAWNVGAREVLARGLDYLVILSASVVFGPTLHTRWTWQMERFNGANVIEATGHSWHLIAFHRRVFEAAGLFDENFFPAYFEAIDFGYRMRQVGMEGKGDLWRNEWVNAVSMGAGMHIPLLDCPAPPLLAYYRDKWGGDKGEEVHVLPWGSRPLDYFPDRSIPELAAAYGLKNWW